MDEETLIDLTIKKKKKKKTFDLDAALGEGHDEPMDTNTTPDKENLEPSAAMEDFDDESLDLDTFGKKKKKKKVKKTTFNLDDLENNLPDSSSSMNESNPIENGDAHGDSNAEEDFSLDMDFSKTKKKKKKKKDLDELVGEELEKKQDVKDEAENESIAWSGSDRDYTYDELLNRVFEIMREKNPDMVAGKKQKFIMRPPQVVRIGTKKTSFANFNEICKTLHRLPKHLLDFLLAELGTSGSVDGNNQLIIKGRFQQKQIENVLKRYIKEYVTCHTCRSPETILQKDTRLFFLQCETCGSRCSVASIKSGFQAVTSKRAAIRAKTV
ncbi:hypothetical protein V9T40_014405 [Parthenolecanium corni]|uniref:Eukaryotic translation initiation factor 2 subunit 2 n=1 Tax=Parthenolecanium corni TaxID=536013 RepID=A0AAN9XXB7_9HEMI